jgi:hypothetical protein
VLEFERQVVDALSTATDPEVRTEVAEWVEGSLAAMPELLRAGVALGSLVLGAWATVTGTEGQRLVDALEGSPLPPVRLHLRFLRSLVLFGDLELSPGARP